MDLEQLFSQIKGGQSERQQRVVLLAGMAAILRDEASYKTPHDVLEKVVGVVLMAAAEAKVGDYPEGKTVLAALESETVKSMPIDESTPVEALTKRLRKMVEEREEEIKNELSDDEDDDDLEHVSSIKFNGPIAEA